MPSAPFSLLEPLEPTNAPAKTGVGGSVLEVRNSARRCPCSILNWPRQLGLRRRGPSTLSQPSRAGITATFSEPILELAPVSPPGPDKTLNPIFRTKNKMGPTQKFGSVFRCIAFGKAMHLAFSACPAPRPAIPTLPRLILLDLICRPMDTH